MYEYLAGVVPTSPGYGTVDIKPMISRNIGPSSVTSSIRTLRGTIESHWARSSTMQMPKRETHLLHLNVTIPPGVSKAIIHVPFLGHDASEVQVQMGNKVVWNSHKHLSHGSYRLVHSANGESALKLEVQSGKFLFTVSLAA